jgi:magnesium and cobalt exporter, CNNM family
MTLVAWLIAIGTAILGALCAAADGALLSPEPSVETIRVGGDRERTHRALAMARVVAYLASGAAAAQALTNVSRPIRLTIGIVFSLLVVGLAEGAARSFGYSVALFTLRRLGWLMRVVQYVLAPVVLIGERIDALLHRLLPPPPADEEDREASAEQFREVVAAEADVSTAEEALIHGVFSLGDTEVREIMVPRVDMVGIEASSPWSEVLDRVTSSEHARFPIYEETLDNMLGILYAKDLLDVVAAEKEPDEGWRTLVRPASFIPPTKTIDAQLRDFKTSRTHIAIVIDEFGGTAGLVTIEDVLEEIVGEIRDEYDVEERDVEREGDARFWVSGLVTVGELSELLGTDFAREDVTTVGGLVYELFGRVPQNGESVVSGGYRIVIERVRRRRIERVYFERLETVASRSET